MPAGLSGPSLLPPHSSQLELVLGMWRWSWSPGKPCLGVPMCFQEREAKDITGVNISCKFLCLLTMYRTLMATGRGSLALAILLATMDIQLGGCIHIHSSMYQKGKQLSLTCTLWYKTEEAEGVIVFLCKDRSSDCSPETSLKQLRLKRDPGRDGVSEVSSHLVFTINQATPSDSGTYQCCARSQKPDIHLQGHFFSVSVTETGNYTEEGLKHTGQPEFNHNKGTLSSGFLQEKVWVMLVTSLVALQAFVSLVPEL
uniref:CD160 antigen isoform X2 n=1 Tax=Nyctereutes procyonoides TaxID=34880 RepID=UPI002443EBDD|nr:CD160 antigen isoform X2 [Nyctereutes procyonoides]